LKKLIGGKRNSVSRNCKIKNKMNLKQKVKQIKSGKLKAVENVMNFGEVIKKRNRGLNVFLHLNENAINEAKEIDKRIKNNERVGKLAGLWSLRIGDYRALYQIRHNELIILVLKIGHRKNIYD